MIQKNIDYPDYPLGLDFSNAENIRFDILEDYEDEDDVLLNRMYRLGRDYIHSFSLKGEDLHSLPSSDKSVDYKARLQSLHAECTRFETRLQNCHTDHKPRLSFDIGQGKRYNLTDGVSISIDDCGEHGVKNTPTTKITSVIHRSENEIFYSLDNRRNCGDAESLVNLLSSHCEKLLENTDTKFKSRELLMQELKRKDMKEIHSVILSKIYRDMYTVEGELDTSSNIIALAIKIVYETDSNELFEIINYVHHNNSWMTIISNKYHPIDNCCIENKVLDSIVYRNYEVIDGETIDLKYGYCYKIGYYGNIVISLNMKKDIKGKGQYVEVADLCNGLHYRLTNENGDFHSIEKFITHMREFVGGGVSVSAVIKMIADIADSIELSEIRK